MSEQLANWRDKNLNSISCSFCAAKWYNVSLHLGHGFTNSCHLPLPHPIDLEKIKTNPSALHNTDFKKEIREYCWSDVSLLAEGCIKFSEINKFLF